MTTIQKKIVAPGHGKFTKPNPIYFAVHSTANPGATAANHVSYWSGGGKDYAVHLVSDWKEAFQCVEFDRVCWQVGNGNKTCIGLEICEATNRADFEKGMAIARDVILQVLAMKGWTVEGAVRSHKWFTENYGGSDHTDPIPYLQKWGWSWNKFLDYLMEGDDMPSVEDIWNFEQNGVKMRDRIQGADEAANAAREYARIAADAITDTEDPTGRTEGMRVEDQVRWMAKKQQEMFETLNKIAAKLDI